MLKHPKNPLPLSLLRMLEHFLQQERFRILHCRVPRPRLHVPTMPSIQPSQPNVAPFAPTLRLSATLLLRVIQLFQSRVFHVLLPFLARVGTAALLFLVIFFRVLLHVPILSIHVQLILLPPSRVIISPLPLSFLVFLVHAPPSFLGAQLPPFPSPLFFRYLPTHAIPSFLCGLPSHLNRYQTTHTSSYPFPSFSHPSSAFSSH